MTGKKEIGRTVTLRSSDGQLFQVEVAVAKQSGLLDMVIKCRTDDESNAIPISMVDGETLKKVIDYCEKHAHSARNNLDAAFAQVNPATLCDLLTAADYMNIKWMRDLICRAVANLIKGKTVEEIRSTFNIESTDFTADEEEEIRREHPWAFQQQL